MSDPVLKCQAENGTLKMACDGLNDFADQSNSRKKGLYIGRMRNVTTNATRLAVWMRVAGTDRPIALVYCPFCGTEIHPVEQSQ